MGHGHGFADRGFDLLPFVQSCRADRAELAGVLIGYRDLASWLCLHYVVKCVSLSCDFCLGEALGASKSLSAIGVPQSLLHSSAALWRHYSTRNMTQYRGGQTTTC